MPELNVWLTLYIFLICLGISGLIRIDIKK